MANQRGPILLTRNINGGWPTYESGSFLLAGDLHAEQQARLQQLRHHNRFLHDWGIVCGLTVVPANELGTPWAVQVCPGYAIGCCGEQIKVSSPARLDVREYLWRRPNDSMTSGYIGIRYKELLSKPVPVASQPCRCSETNYELARLQDTFQISVLWEQPDEPDALEFDPCLLQRAPCPDCANQPYVVLARIVLPHSEGDPITRNHIFQG